MGFKKDKQDIISLLNNHRQLIAKQTLHNIPGNYAQIQQAAILQELDDETEKLLLVFSAKEATPESLKGEFQTLCDQRDKRNQGTCLSYTALPEGVCNRLYIDIATRLFKPTKLDEMLHLLMPGINELLTIKISDFLAPKNVLDTQEDRVQILLKTKPVNVLSSYQFQSSVLSQIIRNDNVMFMPEQIEKFPLGLHHKFYKLLNAAYPELSSKLYKHNDDLKQLFFDIELIEKNGQTPNEVLTHFTQELIRSGSRYTGNLYAAEPVIQACLQFRAYLDQLPQTLRDEVLALQTPDLTTSLLGILEDQLAKGQCVETAAGQIKLILANQQNCAVLKKVPYATDAQLSKIKEQYRKKISIIGYEDTKVLPELLRKEVLKHIKINSTNDYIDLFINLPPSEYHFLLTQARITCYPALPESLGSAMEMLDEEQLLAFLNTIIDHQQKFGGLSAVLKLFISIKMTTVFETSLKRIPSNILANIIRRNTYGTTLLHEAASQDNLDILSFFLKSLPEQDRFRALQEKNRHGTTPLYYAVQNTNPEIFRAIWSSLSMNERSIVANAKNYEGLKLLYFAAQRSHHETWQIIWNFYSRQDKNIAINKRNQDNRALLDWVIDRSDPAVLRSILEPLSDKERLAAVLAKTINGNSVLNNVLQNNSKAFYIIWELLTEENRLIAANEQNLTGSRMLHFAAQRSCPAIWQLIWNFYSKQERLIAAKEKDTGRNYRLLYWAVKNANPDVVGSILEYLPENERIAVLLEKNKDGYSLLYWIVRNNNKVAFDVIWSYCSKTDRLTAIKETHQDKNLLYIALHFSPGILDVLLQELSQEERILIAREKSVPCGTWLNKAAGYIDYKAALAMWRSLSQQDQLDLMQVFDNDGDTLFHITMYRTAECFCLFWQSLAEQNRHVAINIKNKDDNNLLHYTIDMRSGLEKVEDIFLVLWNSLSAQEKMTALREKNKNNKTLLFLAANSQPKIFNLIWNSLAHQDQLEELFTKDNDDNTLLRYIILNCKQKVFITIWKSLSEEDKRRALEEPYKDNESLLYLAKYKPKVFNLIWNDLSKQSRLIEIRRKDKAIPHYILMDNEIFYPVWEFLSEQDRFAMQEETDDEGRSLVHLAVKNGDEGIFFSLWQTIAPQERFAVVQKKTTSGETLLHIAATGNPEILYAILQDLSRSERLAAIQQKDNKGKTPVHVAVIGNQFNSLFFILEFLSESDKLLVLQEKIDGDTPLHQSITQNSPAMARAIYYLAQEDRLAAVLEHSKEGQNLLQRAIQLNSEIFYIIWESLSEQDRLIAKNSKTLNGLSLLGCAAQKSTRDLWQTVWNSYTDEELSIAIKEKGGPNQYTLLHWAVQNPNKDPLNSMLGFLSHALCDALMEGDREGNTPLHLLLKLNIASNLRSIFNKLSGQDSLTILKAKDQSGNSLLHHAAKHSNPRFMRILLRSLPEQERLNRLIERDEFGNSSLHLAAQNSSSNIWSTMMKYLPEKDRLQAATEMSACGDTPIQRASENPNPECLLGILELYPESLRLEAIDIVECWWRRNAWEGRHWELLNEAKRKIQTTLEPRQSNSAKVSELGIFSKPKIVTPNENLLTPLQSVLLEGFEGFKK